MNKTIVVDKHEGVFDRDYVESLESELERQRNLVTIMSKRLSESESAHQKLKEDIFVLVKDAIQ